MAVHEKIAIVSLAIRFPGSAADLGQFWQRIVSGIDGSSEVPPGRWQLPATACVSPGGPFPDRVPHSRGYYLEPFVLEAGAVNLPAELLDGLDRLFHTILDVGHRAWKQCQTAGLDRRRVGVILGNICLPTPLSARLAREIFGSQQVGQQTDPRNRYVAGLPAGLLARSLGLGGCAFTLDAACASSLYAIKLACDELLAGRADAMIAGGANGADPQYTQMGFAQLRALSASGRCAPLDRRADGLLVGEGAGVVVLKRASDAIRDGDRILGLVAGWGVSNDQFGNLLAPAVEGQLRAMRAAYDRAGWTPSDVDLIECHATGTPVGDAIEFESLRQLWDSAGVSKLGQCVLGSVKSTVGHLLTGAGIASLAKVLLAMEARVKPPQTNFEAADPDWHLETSPFRILQQPEPWEAQKPTAPRRAALSGFGFGGVNAHLLVEEYVGQPVRRPGTSVGPSSPGDALEGQDPIAIVGMAAHFGPWKTLREFQEFVLGGGVVVPARERVNGWGQVQRVCPPGHYLEELTIPLDRFRIPPKELEEMLPQQLLMLQIAADALEDSRAGRSEANSIQGDPRTGVFIGLGLDPNTTNFHLRWASLPDTARVGPALTANRTMGALGSITASRIARAFGFGGPSFTCCSEEGSAARAIELAVRALRRGELARAVVGGVDIAGDPRNVLVQPVGRLPGEGAAAVILKRLSDAERDGDRVYAVIRGVGSAVGGPAMAAGPDAATVASSFLRACSDAVIDPATATYLDAGSSGDSGEDRAEQEALRAFLSATQRSIPLAIGAVRKQIGHAGAASALAGVIKASLALSRQILPPSEIRTGESTIRFGPRYWLKDEADGPRRAIVAATSADGTATHLILEEALTVQSGFDPQPLGARPEALFVIQGETPGELVSGIAKLADMTFSAVDRPVEFLARKWWRETSAMNGQVAVSFVARTTVELQEQLALARESIEKEPETPIPGPGSTDLRGGVRDRVFYSPRPVGGSARVAFVFPGSGNAYAGMGRDLSVLFPQILRQQQQENRLLRSQYSPEHFWGELIPEDTTARQFLFGQVTHGTLVADILRLLGVPVHVLLGQSLGESAGLFGLRIWRDRDEMYQRIQASSLFRSDLAPPYEAARRFWNWPDSEPLEWISGVLGAPAETVRRLLDPQRKAYVLIVTTANECVIGGLRAEVETLVKQISAPFFPLHGVTLAHCEAATPVAAAYRELHTLPTTRDSDVTVISGAWGRRYEAMPEECAASITAGLLGTIDFPRAIEAAYTEGVRVFLEVGPGSSTTRMITTVLADRAHLARALTAPRQDSLSLLLRTLAVLAAERLPVDLSAIYGGESPAAGHQDEPRWLQRQCIRIPVGLKASSIQGKESLNVTIDRNLQTPTESLSSRHDQYEFTNTSSQQNGEPRSVYGDNGSVPSQSYPAKFPNAVTENLESRSTSNSYVEPMTDAARTSGNGHNPSGTFPSFSTDLIPVVQACANSQTAVAEAHAAFLRVQSGLNEVMASTLQLHNRLLSDSVQRSPVRADSRSAPDGTARPSVPRSLSIEQCYEFARGKIGNVLGPLYAEVDSFPTRVRLPDGPLMLVDRIVQIEGEPRSLRSGRVITEHHVHAGRWYLDAGRIPTCVAVEAGQADLFLSAFLGIDFVTRGLAVYRLIDAVVQFHQGLPRVGETIRYDIHIDEFVHQGDAWLFRFRFESTVNDRPLLSMTNGVAGFFTAAALASGQGIVQSRLDRQAIPGKKPSDWPELVPLTAGALDPNQVEALRQGDLDAAFGPVFALANLHTPMRLPGGMLRLIDRVPRLDPFGGRFGLGFIRAEYDIHPDDWFLTCHFVDDMVMPGTLMYECCLHTLRVLLMRFGWVGEEGEVATEPVPGVSSRLKCRGQVIPTTRVVAYEVSVKEVGFGPEPFAIADALMYADGKPIVEITNMSLQMTGLSRERLLTIWAPRTLAVTPASGVQPGSVAVQAGVSLRKPALYDSAKILAFSNGNPSEAFGEPYRIFDSERRIARLPGPPFQFLDRVTAVSGEPFVLQAGAACECQYDVPPDAWYFQENRGDRMPFSILLEIALQPCGWLAAYCGSALVSDVDLSFRNLGGKATQFLPVTPTIGTLTVQAKLTSVSRSAGMIIQHFQMSVISAGGVVYEGTTYFGFFTAEALAKQVGMPQARVPFLSVEQRLMAESGRLPEQSPFPGHMLRMIDQIDGYLPAGGEAGLGLVQGRIRVDPSFWFFQAHFYQDPVWPGSLGLESFLQLLKYVAWKRWGPPPAGTWQTVALAVPHEWTYRGQVIPSDKEVVVVLEITRVEETPRRLTARGYLTVDGRIIYQMNQFTLECLS